MTKNVQLTCDGCNVDLTKNVSAAITLFDFNTRRDFCTPACFRRYYEFGLGGR